eukprot:scaffold5487_cov67-Phaeocystis_antarctica.AAC.2
MVSKRVVVTTQGGTGWQVRGTGVATYRAGKATAGEAWFSGSCLNSLYSAPVAELLQCCYRPSQPSLQDGSQI